MFLRLALFSSSPDHEVDLPRISCDLSTVLSHRPNSMATRLAFAPVVSDPCSMLLLDASLLPGFSSLQWASKLNQEGRHLRVMAACVSRDRQANGKDQMSFKGLEYL
jgi:hypothetical protein